MQSEVGVAVCAACFAEEAPNEVAVERFLAGEIGFYDIPRLVEKAMTQVPSVVSPTLEDILEADDAARKSVMR